MAGTDNLPKKKYIILLIVDVILVVAAVLGSYFVLRAFHKFHNLRTASSIILVSLSTADGLLAIPSILDIILLSLKYDKCCSYSGYILKKVSGSFTFFLVAVIILHLTLMSVERFVSVKFASRYHTIVTKRRALIISIAMWVWALFVMIVLPNALRGTDNDCRMFYKAISPHTNTSEGFWKRGHLCRGLLLFTAGTMFLIPLVIIICSYSYVFVVSSKQRELIREQINIPGMPTIKRQMKGARTIAAVVSLCLFSIIPLLVVTCLRFFGTGPKKKIIEFVVYDVVAGLNAICIPLVLGWRNEEFRNAFRELFFRRSLNSSLSSRRTGGTREGVARVGRGHARVYLLRHLPLSLSH